VAFVKHGRVVRELSLADSSSSLDVELIVTPLDGTVTDGLRQLGADVVSTAEGKVRLHVTSETVIPHIVRWLVSRDIDVHAISARRKSLEEWFLDVMGDDQRPG
jgi:hypothetical protein